VQEQAYTQPKPSTQHPQTEKNTRSWKHPPRARGRGVS